MRNLILFYLAPFLIAGFSNSEEVVDLTSLFTYDDNKSIEEVNDAANYITIQSSSIVDIEAICREITNAIIYIQEEDITIDCSNYKNNQEPLQHVSVVKRDLEEGSGDDVPKELDLPLPNTDKPTIFDNSEDKSIQNSPKDEEPSKDTQKNLQTIDGFSKKEPGNETSAGKSLLPKETPEDDPKQGEVGEKNKKASKDTKILIFLFVAVVAVGLAAFGYNFIKKRRQNSRELLRVEEGVKAKVNNEVKSEEMKEMKPLMKEENEKAENLNSADENNHASTSDNNNPAVKT